MIWKTLVGRCIYQSPGGCKVYQNHLYRWMTFGSDAVQTLINRHHSYQPGLVYINPLIVAVKEQPADCCLLGLGGAGVAHVLSAFLGKSQIIAVESSQDVIDTAKTYFMIDQLQNLKIVHQDANIFVQQCESQYQHLLLDLSDAYSFPAHCNNEHFFAHCYRLLLPDGVLAVNLANIHEQRPVFSHVRKIFNCSTVAIPVKGTANMVILACNSDSVSPLISLLQKNKHLKKLTWDKEWGCIAQI